MILLLYIQKFLREVHMLENLYLLLGASPSAGGGTGGTGGAASLLPFVLIFLVMYLLIIRPQSKKQKQHRSMIANVAKGDKIVTIGGIHGIVTQVNKTTINVKVGDNTKLEFNKESIAHILVNPDSKPETTKSESKKSSNKKSSNNPEQQEEESLSEKDSSVEN